MLERGRNDRSRGKERVRVRGRKFDGERQKSVHARVVLQSLEFRGESANIVSRGEKWFLTVGVKGS